MRTVLVFGAVFVAMGCQPEQTPVLRGHQPAPTLPVAPSAQFQQRGANDRSIVYGNHKKWCYAERDEDNDGDCMDEAEACQQVRNKRSEWDLAMVLRTVPDEKKQTEEQRLPYARAVLKGITECEQWDASACFAGTEVVQGYKFELCFPTMSTCERKLFANHNNPDVSLSVERCYVYRTRATK